MRRFIPKDLANKSIEWKETMINYLLKELYSNDDLSSYATSIEYLRKLEEFDESEIRLKFLLVSYCYFDSFKSLSSYR